MVPLTLSKMKEADSTVELFFAQCYYWACFLTSSIQFQCPHLDLEAAMLFCVLSGFRAVLRGWRARELGLWPVLQSLTASNEGQLTLSV